MRTGFAARWTMGRQGCPSASRRRRDRKVDGDRQTITSAAPIHSMQPTLLPGAATPPVAAWAASAGATTMACPSRCGARSPAGAFSTAPARCSTACSCSSPASLVRTWGTLGTAGILPWATLLASTLPLRLSCLPFCPRPPPRFSSRPCCRPLPPEQCHCSRRARRLAHERRRRGL